MARAQDEWSLTAELARLKLDETEALRLADEAEKMRELFQTMSRADVEGLEPTTHALVRENRIREDAVSGFNHVGDLLDASPETEDEFFLIPNVL